MSLVSIKVLSFGYGYAGENIRFLSINIPKTTQSVITIITEIVLTEDPWLLLGCFAKESSLVYFIFINSFIIK